MSTSQIAASTTTDTSDGARTAAAGTSALGTGAGGDDLAVGGDDLAVGGASGLGTEAGASQLAGVVAGVVAGVAASGVVVLGSRRGSGAAPAMGGRGGARRHAIGDGGGCEAAPCSTDGASPGRSPVNRSMAASTRASAASSDMRVDAISTPSPLGMAAASRAGAWPIAASPHCVAVESGSLRRHPTPRMRYAIHRGERSVARAASSSLLGADREAAGQPACERARAPSTSSSSSDRSPSPG